MTSDEKKTLWRMAISVWRDILTNVHGVKVGHGERI